MLPAAKAGASFQAAIKNGKFQGIICPTTPIGSLNTILKNFSSKTVACPSSARIHPAKYLKCFALSGTSTAIVSRIGLPLSKLSVVAKSSVFSSIMSAILFKIVARSLTVVFLQALNASLAASTALFTSLSLASGKFAKYSELAGLYASRIALSSASTHSPFINILKLSFFNFIILFSPFFGLYIYYHLELTFTIILFDSLTSNSNIILF